jgi:hypothetical protein
MQIKSHKRKIVEAVVVLPILFFLTGWFALYIFQNKSEFSMLQFTCLAVLSLCGIIYSIWTTYDANQEIKSTKHI